MGHRLCQCWLYYKEFFFFFFFLFCLVLVLVVFVFVCLLFFWCQRFFGVTVTLSVQHKTGRKALSIIHDV